MQKDIEAMNDDGPAGELGLDLPEMNPLSSRSVVADNADDVDTDVVAQQRWLDLSVVTLLACLLSFTHVSSLNQAWSSAVAACGVASAQVSGTVS